MSWLQAIRRPSLKWLYGGALDARDDILGFYRACEEQGGLVKTHIWRLPLYVVTSPELIEEVLIRKQRCFIKSGALRSSKLAFGQGLLTSDNDLWLHQRKTLQPAFHADHLERYGRVVEEVVGRFIESYDDGEVRNIHRDMTDLCFEVLARSLFGENLPAARRLVAATAEALHAFHHLHSQWIGNAGGLAFAGVRAVATAMGRPDFVVDPSLLPTSYSRQFRYAVEALDEFVGALVERKRREPPGDDFFSLLLAARDAHGAPLSDEQIRDEIVTMFLAGHETAASALSWTLYLLARHPTVERTLAAQLDRGEGTELLEQITREGLRLYPPAYRISRTTVTACDIGGTRVNPGVEVMIPQFAVQRSPRYFEEPNEFRPQRWTEDFIEQLPRFAYFPFGGGPRTCIGSAFSHIESSIVLAAFVRRFVLEVPSDIEPRPYLGVTLLPEGNSIELRLKERKPRLMASAAAATPVPQRLEGGCPFHRAN
jgi:cytochrome P450